MANKAQQLIYLTGRLDALSPLKVLGRGYAIARLEKSGALVRDPQQVKVGDLLSVQLEKGSVAAVITAGGKRGT